MLSEELRMLTSAASEIKYPAGAWHESADQVVQASTFTVVILEIIDRIIKLGTVKKRAVI
jgi:hypothetical protein